MGGIGCHCQPKSSKTPSEGLFGLRRVLWEFTEGVRDGEGSGLFGPGNVTKSFTFRFVTCCPEERGLMMICFLLKDNESVGLVFIGSLCPFSPPRGGGSNLPNQWVLPSGLQVHLLGPGHSQLSDHLRRQVKHLEEPEVRVEKLGEDER